MRALCAIDVDGGDGLVAGHAQTPDDGGIVRYVMAVSRAISASWTTAANGRTGAALAATGG